MKQLYNRYITPGVTEKLIANGIWAAVVALIGGVYSLAKGIPFNEILTNEIKLQVWQLIVLLIVISILSYITSIVLLKRNKKEVLPVVEPGKLEAAKKDHLIGTIPAFDHNPKDGTIVPDHMMTKREYMPTSVILDSINKKNSGVAIEDIGLVPKNKLGVQAVTSSHVTNHEPVMSQAQIAYEKIKKTSRYNTFIKILEVCDGNSYVEINSVAQKMKDYFLELKVIERHPYGQKKYVITPFGREVLAIHRIEKIEKNLKKHN